MNPFLFIYFARFFWSSALFSFDLIDLYYENFKQNFFFFSLLTPWKQSIGLRMFRILIITDLMALSLPPEDSAPFPKIKSSIWLYGVPFLDLHSASAFLSRFPFFSPVRPFSKWYCHLKKKSRGKNRDGKRRDEYIGSQTDSSVFS